MTLYEDHNEIARYIFAEVMGKVLNVDLQDLGPDDYEYEQCTHNIPLDDVCKALGLTSYKEVEGELKRRFNTNSAFDYISTWLDKNNIKCEYWAE